MAQPTQLQRDVFLACAPLFQGQSAGIRQTKAIRKVVQKHHPRLKGLFKSHTYEKVVKCLQALLERRAFESTQIARQIFPDLYTLPEDRDSQRTTCEHRAALAEVEAAERAESDKGGNYVETEDGNVSHIGEGDTAAPAADHPQLLEPPALFPAYLPFRTQHRVLTQLQAVLESECFEFAKQWIPHIFGARKWDCPEAVELNEWAKVLVNYRSDLPAVFSSDQDRSLAINSMFSLTRIRHAAVHRKIITAGGVVDMAASASWLATTLNSTGRAESIRMFHEEITSVVEEMNAYKVFLQNRLDKELEEIAEQRAELDRREQAAIALMLEDDAVYKEGMAARLDNMTTTLLGDAEEAPSTTVDKLFSMIWAAHYAATDLASHLGWVGSAYLKMLLSRNWSLYSMATNDVKKEI